MKSYSRTDVMKIAIEQHLKCAVYPRVGAVIVKDGEILSTGFKGEIMGVHAERVAIGKLSAEELENATIFTTLEPCVTIQGGQITECCTDLIIKSGIKEVVIGVLDPNGTIYSQGYKKLLENEIKVSFFNSNLRAAIEAATFQVGDVHKLIGPGKRRIPVVKSGHQLDIQFSQSDSREIKVSWGTLQFQFGKVDLIGSDNEAVRVASGAISFSDITDPTVFRFPSHFARLEPGQIAIVNPKNSTFCVLFKLVEVYENDILIQWEMRNL